MVDSSNLAFDGPGAIPVDRYDFFDTAVEYSNNHSKFFKAVSTFTKLFTQAGWVPEEHQGAVDGIQTTANLIKLSYAPGKTVKGINDFRKEFAKFYDEPSFKTGRSAFVKAAGIIPPIYEGADFFTKAVFFVPRASIQALTGIAGFAIAISNLDGVRSSLKKIIKYKPGQLSAAQRKEKFEKAAKAMIKLAAQVSYIAIGVMLVLMSFFNFVFAPLTITALSTICVVSGIVEHYYGLWGTEKNKVSS